MKAIRERGWLDALRQYLHADRPFFGICLGMQLLFHGSEESPNEEGLCIIPGMITKFDSTNVTVPQIGWNGLTIVKNFPIIYETKDADMVINT